METRGKLKGDKINYPRLRVPALIPRDLLNDAFMAMMRSGAGFLEVGVRLQKGLRALANLKHDELAEAARYHAALALEQNLEKIKVAAYREALEKVALR